MFTHAASLLLMIFWARSLADASSGMVTYAILLEFFSYEGLVVEAGQDDIFEQISGVVDKVEEIDERRYAPRRSIFRINLKK